MTEQIDLSLAKGELLDGSPAYQAVEIAIKALETLDDVKHTVYRNEWCANKGKCIDYIGYHCAGCGYEENKE